MPAGFDAMLTRLRLRPMAMLVASLGLGACASVPPYERPSALIPAQWPASSPAAGTLDARTTEWRAFFRDPQLQQLIDAALDHNRDLRAALARVMDARAQADVAQAERRPAIHLTSNIMGAKFPGELSGSGNPIISRRADFSLSAVSYELDFWGRVASASEAARERLLASEDTRRALTISVVSEVASQYYSLLELDERIGVARTVIATRERSFELTRRAYEQGAAPQSDVLLAEAQLNGALGELAILENQRASVDQALSVLTGKPQDNLGKTRKLFDQELNAELAAGIPSDVILQRPDVLAAEHRLKEARANIEAARAAFLPKILLTAALGFASKSLSGLFGVGTGNWSYQPTMTLPLFDGGRTAGYYDMAAARQEGAVADYEKTIQQAFREIADLLASRASLIKQAKAAEAAVKAHEQRRVVAEARYKAGGISYMEVLDTQRELSAARQMLIQVRRAQLNTAAQLYKALGGGELPRTG